MVKFFFMFDHGCLKSNECRWNQETNKIHMVINPVWSCERRRTGNNGYLVAGQAVL